MNDQISDYEESIFAATMLVRGQIISSYSQVEYLLADLPIRCHARPEYADLMKKFPYKLESRLAAVKRLAAVPGPISLYKEEILGLIDNILKYEEIRHFMAHGLLIVNISKDDHVLHFKLHDVKKKGEISEGYMNTNLEQLNNAGLEIAVYSQSIVKLFYRIYMEQGLQSA